MQDIEVFGTTHLYQFKTTPAEREAVVLSLIMAGAVFFMVCFLLGASMVTGSPAPAETTITWL